MNEENRWNVENWNALRGLPWDATETGAEAAEAVRVSVASGMTRRGNAGRGTW